MDDFEKLKKEEEISALHLERCKSSFKNALLSGMGDNMIKTLNKKEPLGKRIMKQLKKLFK